MATETRQRTFLPELFDWAESFHPLFAARSLIGPHPIRIEDTVDDNSYVIKAELPGIDPEKDVKISLDDNALVIEAERSEEKSDKTRSEFQYGSFRRVMSLPAGVKADDIKATYTDGILTVTIGMAQVPATKQQIPIERG